MIPRLVVFDLDGTLIDSRVDLANSVNATLLHLGRPVLPDAVIASYIGNGVSMLVRRALGDPEGDVHDDEYVDEAVEFFLGYYREHKLDFTYVYEGVVEALDAIRAEIPGVAMAVLTNKPVRPSRDICAHFGLSAYFFQNYGGNSFHTKKPDPTGLLALMAEASVLEAGGRAPEAAAIGPAETVMIGDSDVDVLTARNCGARSVGCLFGLAPHSLAAAEPDAVVGSPMEWVHALRVIAG
jgi:phosphoglycolate phosphatase